MNTIDATNLHRFMNCNGSHIMPAAFPSIDSDPTARDEGNAAHWAAQQWLNGRDPATLENTKAYNGVIVTGEMLDHVKEYLEALDCGTMEAVTSFGNDQFRVNGRCDHWSFDPNRVIGYINGGNGNVIEDVESVLTVDDFKYGRSLVEAENNWTLIAHAVGLCIMHQIAPSLITLRIHQPRPYHPDGKLRAWTITYDQLMQFYAQIAHAMTNPSDELRTGLEWCRKCRALATCPAARSARMNIIDATTSTFTDQLPDDALGYELSIAETAQAMLNAQVDAMKELISHRLKGGAVIDNYAVEPQYANTRWLPGITPEALTLVTGIDCTKPGTITPAEAKRRGMSEAIIKSLTDRPMTGTKLVRVSADKRAQRLLRK